MKKYFYILFFTFNSILCLAQSGIRVTLVNIPKRVAPGSYFNLIFDVQSANTFTEPMTVSLKIPDTWEILSQKEPEVIIGEKKIKYIFSVNTSAFTPPGTITSRILINTASGYRIEKPFQIQVPSVRRIIISPVLLPESAKEGDSLNVEYLVENRGNIKDNLKLEALGGKISGKTDINGLNPDESTNIFAKFLIPKGETNSFNFAFGIRATLKDSLKPVNFTNSIIVYSKKIKKTELYNRFPINVGFLGSLFFINNKPKYNVMADINGAGFLDRNNRHLLRFTIRGPNNITNQASNQFYNNYDVYNLGYKYSKNKFMAALEVGDYDLRINQLIENGRFGRGFNLETRYNKIGIYAFYTQPRFFNQQRQTFGGSLYYLPNPKLRLSIDYSSKYFQIKRFVWVNLVGVQSIYKSEKLNIQGELVGGMYSKKYDFGASTLFDFKIKKINFGGNYIYAGKEFYGFLRDSYLINNSASLDITKKIYLNVNATISRLNPSRDFNDFNVSPFITSYSGTTGYRINQISSADLTFMQLKIEDRMEVKRFFYQQQLVRLGYSLFGKKIRVNYIGSFGTGKNFLAIDNPSINKQNISNTLEPEVRILPWAWAGLYAQHERTSRFSVQNQLTDYFYYGASLRLPIKNKYNVDLMYRSNYAPDQLTKMASLLSVSANLNLGRHRVELTGGKRIIPSINSSFINDLYFILRYSYRLNVPVSRLKNLGNIQGQIAVTSDGLKKEGIVMTLGDKKFVSDKDGKFFFKHLVPDKYYLDIDQTSLPKGVITNLKLPLEVDLKGDSTSQINLSLTKTGTIVGKVLFANIENDEGKGKPSVLITVSNDTEKLYTRVNKDDVFSCKQVKPGKWTITASIIGGDPEDYTITDATQSIEVEADGSVEVDFTIENYKRTIEFNPSTFNLIDKKETKQNTVTVENSVTKENNDTKENSVIKDNSVTKDNDVAKENNVSKENKVSKENNDSWSNNTSPINKSKPKTTPKTKSIVKDVKQTKNTSKSTNKNKTNKQGLKKKPNYTIISI